MTRLGPRSLLAFVCFGMLSGYFWGTAVVADVTKVSPESVGFSSNGLKAYEQALHAMVDERRLAGVTTLVARRGKVVSFDAYGYEDAAKKTPMTTDTTGSIPRTISSLSG